jgi:hypothetical protein
VGRYDVARCDANGVPSSLAQDPCNALNAAAGACEVYQCDGATGTCRLGRRDADRDGEPGVACGGKDCDDADGRRSGTKSETCDGVDDDCDGIADEGLLALQSGEDLKTGDFEGASLADTAGTDLIVTSGASRASGGTCLLALGDRGAPIDAPCTFLGAADGIVPTQAVTRPLPGADVTYGAVFSDVGKACPPGRIAFRNTKSVGVELGCDGLGASLPSLQAYAPRADGRELAVAAWIRAAASLRSQPVAACSAAAEAPLAVAWIEGPAAREPAPRVVSTKLELTASRATRPPAMLPRGDAVLLAAPSGAGAAVWLLEAPAAGTSTPTVIPLVDASALPLFTGAVSVTAALATDGGVEQLALVGEIGCPPRQRIVWTLLRLDEPGPVATVVRTRELTDAEMGVATAPRLAWSAARREWWTAWVSSVAADDLGPGRVVNARAVSSDGAAAGDLLRGPAGAARVAVPAVTEVKAGGTTDPAAVPLAVLGAGAYGRLRTGCR